MNVAVPPGLLPATYPLTITAVNPAGCTSSCAITQSEAAWLTISGGQGFSITVTSASPQPFAPGGSATYNVTVNGGGGYTGSVSLSPQTPSGWSASLGNGSLAPGQSTTLTVTAPSGTNFGQYPILVAGAAGGVTHYGAGPAILAAPSPASVISPVPGALSLNQTNQTTFSWNAGVGATSYSLALATAPNGSPFSSSGTITATAIPNVTIPSGAQTVYATLTTNFASASASQLYAYTLPPAGVAPLNLGTATVRRSGPAYTLSATPADTITGCSAPPGIITSITGAGQSVSISAGPSAAVGSASAGISCSGSSGTTYSTGLVVDIADPVIGNVQATQQSDGSFTVKITGSGFGDTTGGLLMQGVFSYSTGNWEDNLIEVDDVIVSDGTCGSYDLVVSPYVPIEDQIYDDESGPVGGKFGLYMRRRVRTDPIHDQWDRYIDQNRIAGLGNSDHRDRW
jgi:hypothetical protein